MRFIRKGSMNALKVKDFFDWELKFELSIIFEFFMKI